MSAVNGFSPKQIAHLTTEAGISKAHETYASYAIKSFLAGVFICLGALVELVIIAGSPGLRSSNPTLAVLISGFAFPLGFVLVVLTNMELCTTNMFVLPFTALQRKVSFWHMLENLILTYIGNLCGALFVAGFLGWWADIMVTNTMKSYAVKQAQDRVNVEWSVNFLRGVGCNILIATAYFMSLGSVEFVSKVYTIWIPVWGFVIAQFQHSIADYFLIPIGMFYGTNFGVGKFIYQNVIPVSLGNLVGGLLIICVPFWYVYGREAEVASNVQMVQAVDEPGRPEDERIGTASTNEEKTGNGRRGSAISDDMTMAGGTSRDGLRELYDRDGMAHAV